MIRRVMARCCGAAFLLAWAACASGPARPDEAVSALLEAERGGESGAALEVARLVGDRGPAAGPLVVGLAAARRATGAEARLWEALFLDALGSDAEAFEAWARLVGDEEAPEGLAVAAAVAMGALVDRVPLAAPHPGAPPAWAALERALGRPGAPGARAAEALEAVALRLEEGEARVALLREARRRLGVVTRYRLVGPIDERAATGRPPLAFDPQRGFDEVAGVAAGRAREPVGLGASAQGASAAQAVEQTVDGRVGIPSAGQGVFAVLVPAPASGALEVEVVGEVAVRVHIDGRLVAEHPALTSPLARRFRSVVAAPASGAIELHLAARSFPTTPRVFVRVAAPEEKNPEGRNGAIAAEATAWAELVVTLADGDPERLGRASLDGALDPSVPVQALWLARALVADPLRPAAEARAAAAGLFDAALAADAELATARAEAVRLRLEDGDPAGARALAAAGPLAEHEARVAVLVAEAAGSGAGPAAERLFARLPSSCDAASRWLDARWEGLKLGAARLPTLPGCFDLRLRAATLLLESRRLDEAESLLAALAADAAPGSERARVSLARGRCALARGLLDVAAGHARDAAATGAELEAALELRLRASLLGGDPRALAAALADIEAAPVSALLRRRAIEPARDLGLPLADGLAIVRAVAPVDVGEPEADEEAGEAEPSAPTPGGGESERGSHEVLLDDRHTRVYPDGTQLHRVHRLVRLLEAHAVDAFGEVELPDEAEVLIARTWKPTPGGGWQPIEPEELAEKHTISLPALAPGAIAELAWWWFEGPEALVAPGWRTPLVSFASDRGPTRLSRWTLRTPSGAAVELVTQGDAPAPTRPEPGLFVFEARDRARVLPEPLDPRPDRQPPAVRAVHAVDPGRAISRLRDGVATGLMSSPVLRALALEATAGLGVGATARDRLAALHAFVLDRVRALDTSPLYDRAAHAAARRSGDRALLLVALARELGLDAELVLVRTLASGALDPRDFEPETYLYAVVRVRLPEGDVWLDAASRFAPFGHLPALVQAGDGLALGEAGPARLTLPRTPDTAGLREVRVALAPSPGGDSYLARGEERLTGEFAASWREALLSMPSERRVAILGTIAQQSLPGAEISAVRCDALDDRGSPLIVRWEARGRLERLGPGRVGLGVALAPERLERGTVLLSSRATPLLVNRSVRLDAEFVLEVPEGLELESLPAAVAVSHAQLAYQRAVMASDGGRTVRLGKRFSLDPTLVSPDGYAAWRQAAREVDRGDTLQLVFIATHNRISEGPAND